MALTVIYKGCEIRVSHNLKDQTEGLLEINRLGNTIYAYTNSSLSTHEVICVIESHWSEISKELALCHGNQYLYGIISPQDIPHKKVTSTVKHVATGCTTLEGVVSRYYGWHRHGRVICDNCGCSVNDYYIYDTKFGYYEVCYNCRMTIKTLNPFFREKSVNFEGSRRKH